jgi:5-methylthioadenosine/S-adenosylhomocysteine deaminase
MMDHGVNVALGTDSILCLDTPDRLSVLDDMRFLYQRDGTDPRQLLAMGTVAGARALGVDPALVALAPGPSAGVIAVDVGGAREPAGSDAALRDVMRSREAPQWVVGPSS